MRRRLLKCLRRISEVAAASMLLAACYSEQAPTALTSDVKYNDFRILSDAEKRIISRGALSGFKDARIRWPQFPKAASRRSSIVP
jgi:hypothetical protein